MPTKSEAELAVQLWQERKNHLQTKAVAINAQSQLLQVEQKEIAQALTAAQSALAEIVAKEKEIASAATPDPIPEAACDTTAEG